jgi:hypothetical protein
MDPEAEVEAGDKARFCPTCGAEESGYFCRVCGSLLRGKDRLLCPRCHQVVPGGLFCNQCGQSLGGIALELRQLAEAGDEFWVTSEAAGPPAKVEPAALFEPDTSVELDTAELPAWLQELSTTPAPSDVEERIYPSLRPIEGKRSPLGRSNLFVVLVLVMFVLMLAMVILTIVIALSSGGGS